MLADLSFPFLPYFVSPSAPLLILMHRKIDATFDCVLQTLEEIPEGLWNRAVSGGTWSVAQVFEHIALSARLPPDRVTGEPDRWFDAAAAHIEARMANAAVKGSCPPELFPQGTWTKKAEFIPVLRTSALSLSRYAEETDLTQLCLERTLLDFGFLTRYEWLVYVCGHTHRHLGQVEQICRDFRGAGRGESPV